MPTASPSDAPDVEAPGEAKAGLIDAPADEGQGGALEQPLLGHSGASRAEGLSADLLALQRAVAAAVFWSLVANVALLGAKAAALWTTGSLAVAASAVDSLVDLASQALVALADAAMARPSPAYPAGKTRLEPLSVLGCAAIMALSAMVVVQESVSQLYDGFTRRGDLPHVEFSPAMAAILGAAFFIKLVLFFVCNRLRGQSGAALALAEDHANDMASNLVAVATAAAASARPQRWWWADPAGGIAISAYIVISWTRIAASQVQKIVGAAAPADTAARLRAAAAGHHPATRVAFFRAFHAGQRLHVDVELESRAPGMAVGEASLIALALKKELEAAPEVESAAVVVVVHPAAALERRPSTMAWDAPMVLPSGDYGGHPALPLPAGRWGRPGSRGGAEGAGVEEGAREDGLRMDSGSPGGAGEEEEAAAAAAAVARGEGSLARQWAWGRSLRDPPAAALRATSFVGLGRDSMGSGPIQGGPGGEAAPGRPGSRG